MLSLKKLVLATASLGTIAILLLTLIAGAAFPGYSHSSQFISELGAQGAPHAKWVNFAGFLPAGVLICAFAIFAWMASPRSVGASLGFFGIALFGFGYFVAAFFPCEAGCRPSEPSPTQVIHNVLGLAGYVTAPFVLVLLGWKARGWAGGGFLSAAGFVCAGFSLAGLVLLSPEFPYVGLAQRLLEASVLFWVMACAFYIARSPVLER